MRLRSSAQTGYLVDAVALDGVVVALQGLHDLEDVLRHFQLGELDDVAKGVVRLDRKNTCKKKLIEARA